MLSNFPTSEGDICTHRLIQGGLVVQNCPNNWGSIEDLIQAVGHTELPQLKSGHVNGKENKSALTHMHR